MLLKPSIFWISGWSVPAGAFLSDARAAWPGADHTVIDPGPDAIAQAVASAADMLGGYSLGAHLLLALEDPRPRVLLAPFADLKREAALGGAVATVQIRQLLRWLKRDPLAAVTDFHLRIGSQPPPVRELPDHLEWGVGRMLAEGRQPPHLPHGSLAIAGRHDPLLDSHRLASIIPALHLAEAGHQPEPLLAAAARLVQSTHP